MACVKCTFVNTDEATQCAICSTPIVPKDQKQCAKCTLLNDITQTNCTVCGSLLFAPIVSSEDVLKPTPTLESPPTPFVVPPPIPTITTTTVTTTSTTTTTSTPTVTTTTTTVQTITTSSQTTITTFQKTEASEEKKNISSADTSVQEEKEGVPDEEEKESDDNPKCEKFGNELDIFPRLLRDSTFAAFHDEHSAQLEDIVFWRYEEGRKVTKEEAMKEFGTKNFGCTGWWKLLEILLGEPEKCILVEVQQRIDEIKIPTKKKEAEKFFEESKKKVEVLRKLPPYNKLDYDLLFGLVIYTAQIFFREMNKTLRKEGPEKEVGESVHKWHVCISSVMFGFRKLPSFKYGGKVYRGVSGIPDELLAKWKQEGSIITFESFTSTSTKRRQITKFLRKDKNTVVFTITSTSGRSLEGLSHYPSECEVLFRPFTSFRVVKVGSSIVTFRKGNRTIKLDATEIEIVEAYPDIRGRRVILWVDDKPINNTPLTDKAEADDVTFIKATSTKEAKQFLKDNQDILKRPPDRFRIITDMGRLEVNPETKKSINNPKAGLELIQHLHDEYGYKNRLFLYTTPKGVGTVSKQVAAYPHVYVTGKASECDKFASFADVRSDKKRVMHQHEPVSQVTPTGGFLSSIFGLK